MDNTTMDPCHVLSLKDSSESYFVCNLCWEKGSGPVYHCDACDFNLHTTCAAMEKVQTHFLHYQHPLRLCRSTHHHRYKHMCNICEEVIQNWSFRCNECNFDMHPQCVRAHRFIMHPSHRHPLTLLMVISDHIECDGCVQDAKGSYVYQCSKCDYHLHMSCAAISRTIKHPQHPEHKLTLCFEPPKRNKHFACSLCADETGDGWFYGCSICKFYVHPDCANINHVLPYASLDVKESPSSTCSFSKDDMEAVERFLHFAKDTVRASSSDSAEKTTTDDDGQNTCPTCLEGFGPANPRKVTGCGHHFHLPCILDWMEQNSTCPVCRQYLLVLV